MWVRLEKSEIDLILQTLPEGSLSEKLRAPLDPDTAAFLAAVETDDDLEVDDDAIISRGDDGAFVMSWSWVSNEMAGLRPVAEKLR
ncbi:hypothetical protein [Rhizobium sp.]|uniref:hypothetical protein n=1 Tax=Rhizobium sp. TaxID=391 RepID=UPI002898D887